MSLEQQVRALDLHVALRGCACFCNPREKTLSPSCRAEVERILVALAREFALGYSDARRNP